MWSCSSRKQRDTAISSAKHERRRSSMAQVPNDSKYRSGFNIASGAMDRVLDKAADDDKGELSMRCSLLRLLHRSIAHALSHTMKSRTVIFQNLELLNSMCCPHFRSGSPSPLFQDCTRLAGDQMCAGCGYQSRVVLLTTGRTLANDFGWASRVITPMMIFRLPVRPTVSPLGSPSAQTVVLEALALVGPLVSEFYLAEGPVSKHSVPESGGLVNIRLVMVLL